MDLYLVTWTAFLISQTLPRTWSSCFKLSVLCPYSYDFIMIWISWPRREWVSSTLYFIIQMIWFEMPMLRQLNQVLNLLSLLDKNLDIGTRYKCLGLWDETYLENWMQSIWHESLNFACSRTDTRKAFLISVPRFYPALHIGLFLQASQVGSMFALNFLYKLCFLYLLQHNLHFILLVRE